MKPRQVLVLLVLALTTGSACRRSAAPAHEAEPPSLDVTSWTEKSELFMEHPPLVAGHSARFAFT